MSRNVQNVYRSRKVWKVFARHLYVFMSPVISQNLSTHTFSAFWLWSSVVSVLISVTTDMSPTGDLIVTFIFHGEVFSWACSGAFMCCTRIALLWLQLALWGNTNIRGYYVNVKPLACKSWSRVIQTSCWDYAMQLQHITKYIFKACDDTCNMLKLTWLVSGEDPAARSHRVEQFTALWGL